MATSDEATGSDSAPGALWLLMGGIATVGIQALMLSPMLTDIMSALAVGPAEIGLATSAYGIGVALSALLAAPRLDAWPRRLSLQLALGIMALSLLLCALAWDWRILVAAQFTIGAAAGIIVPGIYVMTSDLTLEATRTKALGRVVLGWSIALCAGVPIAALLADLLGWRGSFVAVAMLSIAAAAAFARLPSPPPAKGSQARVRYRDALLSPGAPALFFGTLAFMFAFYATYTFLGDHLRQLHGSGAWLGGLVAMAYGTGFAAAMVSDGWLSRIGPRAVAPFSLAAMGINYSVLPFAAENVAAIVAYAFAWGAAAHVAMTSLVSSLSRAPVAVRAAVLSLFSAVTYLAQGVAGAAMGSVYAQQGFYAASWTAAVGVFLASGVLAPRPKR